MTGWHVVIATGASLLPDPQAVADSVRHLPTVAVSDAYKLAPWAAALVACDGKWWAENPEALRFAGERWLANGSARGVEMIKRQGPICTQTNSGLLGLDYWIRRRARRVLLLGIDMRGSHYFGPHARLRNTTPARFEFFCAQFDAYARWIMPGVEVVNCSPDSALETFPKRALADVLTEDNHALHRSAGRQAEKADQGTGSRQAAG